MELLHAHILSQEPGAVVEVIRGWFKETRTRVEDRIHEKIKTYRPTGPHKHYLLFDNAQDTYWDGYLWEDFFKDTIQRGSRTCAILFCSYGSPTARPVDHDNGAPLVLPESARISLTPDRIDTSDPEFLPIGLLFSGEEFEEAVNRFKGPDYGHIRMDQDLRRMLFEWTMGHAGAVGDLLYELSCVVSPICYYRIISSPTSQMLVSQKIARGRNTRC
jgi:hypothetical protein